MALVSSLALSVIPPSAVLHNTPARPARQASVTRGIRRTPPTTCSAAADVALRRESLPLRQLIADVAVGPSCHWPVELVVGASCCLAPKLLVGASCNLLPDELARDVAPPCAGAAPPVHSTSFTEFLMAYRHMLEHESVAGGDVGTAAEHVMDRVRARVEGTLMHTSCKEVRLQLQVHFLPRVRTCCKELQQLGSLLLRMRMGSLSAKIADMGIEAAQELATAGFSFAASTPAD